jgi:hypothetical protein
MTTKDPARAAPAVLSPFPPSHRDNRRDFQGIPGIERMPGGRFLLRPRSGEVDPVLPPPFPNDASLPGLTHNGSR